MPRPFWLTKLLVRTGVARWLPSIRLRLDGGATYLRYYSDRCLAAPIDALLNLSASWSTDDPDAIDLACAAPRCEAPSPARIAPTRGYPQPGGNFELRSAIADHLATGQLSVSPTDEVLVTPGAISAFAIALDTFVNTGDRVALFDPCSPLFCLGLAHRRARIEWIPTTIENGIVRFDVDRFAKSLVRTKLLILSHPVNPTGGVLDPADLELIAWWAQKRDVLIYCDESFSSFNFEGRHVSIGSLPAALRRTISAGSMSHGWGQAAIRVGWLAGFRHLVRPCAVTAALTNPFTSMASQQAALMALRQSGDVTQRLRESASAKRRFVFERLTDLGLEPAWPAGGLFVWFNVQSLGISGRDFAERLFSDQRVLVSPGDLFGPSATHFVRLSLAADDGRLREGLTRLAEFVEELRTPDMSTPNTSSPISVETPVGA